MCSGYFRSIAWFLGRRRHPASAHLLQSFVVVDNLPSDDWRAPAVAPPSKPLATTERGAKRPYLMTAEIPSILCELRFDVLRYECIESSMSRYGCIHSSCRGGGGSWRRSRVEAPQQLGIDGMTMIIAFPLLVPGWHQRVPRLPHPRSAPVS
ncbi:hypothetical protein IQ07DRAFT_585146 [Pyrenochaeta sp. DS3sAY3a]|nr:hypothetical protein IQ07DRAFT_585146 [Pyrenochaeta sp. DS3sAY3a]